MEKNANTIPGDAVEATLPTEYRQHGNQCGAIDIQSEPSNAK